jgi:polyphenol oxidase
VTGSVASLKQIHSSKVIRRSEPGLLAEEGDALVSNRRGLAISVRTADCLPILLADPRNQAAGVVHAGWRGSAARISIEALRTMSEEFGTRAQDVRAAIGPGIGACCYEVGAEVAREFGIEGKTRLDLAGINRGHLIEAGLLPENIEALGACTFCDAERFYSYRRENEQAGRMVSYIRLL